MRRKIYNKYAFTLIELMVALLISSLLITAIGTFLITNLKSFNTTQKSIDLQYEAQLVMNQLVEQLMMASQITIVEDSTTSVISNSNCTDVRKFAFNVNSDTVTITKQATELKYDISGDAIADEVISNKVKLFQLDTGNVSISLGNSKTVIVKLELEDKGSSYSITNQVKLRNKN